MKANQIFEILSTVVKETLGDSIIVNEDLSNVVEVGSSIFGANACDNYVKSLVDRIGQTIFVSKKYGGQSLNLLMDNWEFGSVTEKVRCNILNAKKNESWDLQDGKSYPSHVFYKPSVGVKFYNDITTFDVPISFTELQVKSSFNSVNELNSFFSMIYNAVDNTLTLMTQELSMRCVNLLIAMKIANKTNKPNGVVHLLTDYKTETGVDLTKTPAKALKDTDFLKYVAETILLHSSRFNKLSKNYNDGDFPTFTNTNDQHLVLIDKLATDLNVYLQSDTYHNEYTKIGSHDTVSFWQGSGKNYALEDITKIDIKHSAIENEDNTITQNMVVGTLFDKLATGISLFNRRTTSEYTPSAEFYTNYNKEDARYFVDTMENAVVFVLD